VVPFALYLLPQALRLRDLVLTEFRSLLAASQTHEGADVERLPLAV